MLKFFGHQDASCSCWACGVMQRGEDDDAPGVVDAMEAVARPCVEEQDALDALSATSGCTGYEDSPGRGPAAVEEEANREDSGVPAISSRSRSMGNSRRTLLFEVPEHLKRGVRLHHVQKRFGAIWHQAVTGGVMSTKTSLGDSFELSETVERLAYFISHNWGSKGFLKFVTLCFFFNGFAANVAALLVATIVGLLQTDWVMLFPRPFTQTWNVGGTYYDFDTGFFCTLATLVTYTFVLLFWQRIRSMFGRPAIMAFVDKACVNQTNHQDKQDAILALSGFLRMSDRLLVLWSPAYFTRLWCVWEIASWIQHKPIENVHVVPIAHAVFIVAGFLTSLGMFLTLSAWCVNMKDYFIEATALTFTVLSTFASVPLVVVSEDVLDLGRQIREFTIEEANCFCCTVDHEHPETHIRLPCDRVLIHSALRSWVAQGQIEEGKGELEHDLHVFDDEVRSKFGPPVLQKLGKDGIGYLTVVMVTGIPFLCFFCDELPLMFKLDNWFDRFRVLLAGTTVALAALPIFLKLPLSLIRLVQRIHTNRSVVAKALCVAVANVSAGCALLVAGNSLHWPDAAAQMLIDSSLFAIAMVLYRDDVAVLLAKLRNCCP